MADTRNRRTLRLSQETTELLDTLKDRYRTSENKIIERCIREFADGRPDANLSLEKRIGKMEEQLFHLMNMVNSICTSLAIKSEEYASAENKQSPTLTQSENEFHIYMMRLKGRI